MGEIIANELNSPRHLLQWGTRPYREDEAMWIVADNPHSLIFTVGSRSPLQQVSRTVQLIGDDFAHLSDAHSLPRADVVCLIRSQCLASSSRQKGFHDIVYV